MFATFALILASQLPKLPALQAARPESVPLALALDEPDMGRPAFTDAAPGGGRDFSRWEVPFGGVDLVSGLVPGPMGASRESVSIDLGGSPGHPGILQSAASILFLPGVRYKLDFSYNSVGGTPEEALVRIGGESLPIHGNTKSFIRETFLFTFPQAVQARLVFQGLGDGRGGVGIGNVSITPLKPPRKP